MSDIKLNAAGDLDLTNGAASVHTDRLDAIAQRLTIRLRFFQGEWFLDLAFGVPYHGRVLIRGANEADLFQLFQFVIESMPGIQAVEELSVIAGGSDDRRLSVVGSALAEAGGLIPFNTGVPVAV
jgi:hypothetical protein